MLTPNRDRAPLIGLLIHLVNGWLVAFIYAFACESWNRAGWWLGVGIGLAVVVALLPLLPGLHARMASEHRGPEQTRALEPPGFLGLNYGRRTPLIALLARGATRTLVSLRPMEAPALDPHRRRRCGPVRRSEGDRLHPARGLHARDRGRGRDARIPL
jgi:hypothetical protein